MSRYEWEQGVITLSTKEMAAMRKAAAAYYNGALQTDLEKLTKLAEAVKLMGKGKRGFNFRAALGNELAREESTFSRWGGRSRVWQFKLFDEYDDDVMRLLLDDAGKIVIPKKTALKQASVRTDLAYPPQHCPSSSGEGGFTFNPERRTVTWDVSENNHACERARESLMGKFFFNYLSKVTWTRGTGGVIVGNDEYNRDDRESGGGGNFTKDRFGPQGAAELAAQLKGLPRTRRKVIKPKK